MRSNNFIHGPYGLIIIAAIAIILRIQPLKAQTCSPGQTPSGCTSPYQSDVLQGPDSQRREQRDEQRREVQEQRTDEEVQRKNLEDAQQRQLRQLDAEKRREQTAIQPERTQETLGRQAVTGTVGGNGPVAAPARPPENFSVANPINGAPTAAIPSQAGGHSAAPMARIPAPAVVSPAPHPSVGSVAPRGGQAAPVAAAEGGGGGAHGGGGGRR